VGNLHLKCPNKMITNGIFRNENKHLPLRPGRIWYEADINYERGRRNTERIVYSNDGLIFVTYDHYHTFVEIK
ncbi:MAG: ribonuclease, partial [Clostridia bacterium]|nr:ribonuclease [Clostridia bacterium]